MTSGVDPKLLYSPPLTDKDELILIFYKDSADFSPWKWGWWINKLARWTTQSPYIHVELYCMYNFKLTDKTKRRRKHFKCSHKNGWEIIPYEPTYKTHRYQEYSLAYLTLEEKSSIIAFVEQKCLQKAHYNFWGLLLFWVWPVKGEDTNSFFCSELLTLAIKKAMEKEYRNRITYPYSGMLYSLYRPHTNEKWHKQREKWLSKEVRPEKTDPGTLEKLIYDIKNPVGPIASNLASPSERILSLNFNLPV